LLFLPFSGKYSKNAFDILCNLILECLQVFKSLFLAEKAQKFHLHRFAVQLSVKTQQMALHRQLLPANRGAFPHVGDGLIAVSLYRHAAFINTVGQLYQIPAVGDVGGGYANGPSQLLPLKEFCLSEFRHGRPMANCLMSTFIYH